MSNYQSQRSLSQNPSVSISIPMNYTEFSETEVRNGGYTDRLHSESSSLYVSRIPEILSQPNHGVSRRKASRAETFLSFDGTDQNYWINDKYSGENEHLLRSGLLGMCNDPYCTTCPTYYNFKARHQRAFAIFDTKFHNPLFGDARGWARRTISFLRSSIPGVMNPHTKIVQWWNKFFLISCLVAIFIDPLFFFMLSVQQGDKCIGINWSMTAAILVLRSIADFLYLVNILLQFRLAYVAPKPTMIGAVVLIDDPKKIALHYLCGYFFVDFFVVLPLPQIIILLVRPRALGMASSGADYSKNLLCAAIVIQYIPRLIRFFPFLGKSRMGFLFETAWANFSINLLPFLLSGHVVGSGWYLSGLQRVNHCLHNACYNADVKENCMSFLDCGKGSAIRQFDSDQTWYGWKYNENASACFTEGGFRYGIFTKAVNLTTEHSFSTRYLYSLFWGFQQISTLAGNQTPGYNVWEVVFTMGIIGLSLLLFAKFIGNMQNFFQALCQRRLEMSIRQRDLEQWMNHRRLPQELRSEVLEAERYIWAATRGVNEEMILENFSDSLQRKIRRHLFKSVKKVWIFSLVEDDVFDSVCERLRPEIHITGSEIFYHGGRVDKMVFIVRGKLESTGEDGSKAPLYDGDVCGEELLAWCLEFRGGKRTLRSFRTIKCLTHVEAFSLRAADLEEVTQRFARNFRNPRVQGAMRYQSPYWRARAASTIQVAWKYRQKRLKISR
ncbi:probable cyclic nucleotide-gated ion channel 20, chloroplastic isoform X2 [Jatropha curcas]|uniref:probable cyclic nucleotide-gated ion channel 20, chloroplastic isoform X2 n=1 Tax=Jatropha curcas TaxID=180498 RepID=UPI0005FB1392|nr:probable cyclic nucleotide-gated ion channel 20, chloroplastic isoform X2 [Jatropha curcas]